MSNFGEIAGCLLDAHDVLYIFAEPCRGLRLNIDAGTARYIVKQGRYLDGIGDGLEAGDQSPLGGLIVIG